MADQEKGILIGRTYVETLVLTLTQIEFSAPSTELLLRIVMRLEDEVCGISTIMPELKELYRRNLRVLSKEYFGKDLPIPESIFERCNALENLLSYLLREPNVVVEGRYVTSVAEERIRMLVARLGRSAVLSAFYACGLIKTV